MIAKIIIIFIVWAIIRWWIEYYPLKLINEYNSLMKYLEELSSMNNKSNQAISEKIFEENKPSFELMRRNVDRKYNKLNTTLHKLIRVPYRLLWTDIILVKTDFIEIVEDTKILYEEFTRVGSNFNFNYDMIRKEYENFISELERSQKKYPTEIPEHLICIPSLMSHVSEQRR